MPRPLVTPVEGIVIRKGEFVLTRYGSIHIVLVSGHTDYYPVSVCGQVRKNIIVKTAKNKSRLQGKDCFHCFKPRKV